MSAHPESVERLRSLASIAAIFATALLAACSASGGSSGQSGGTAAGKAGGSAATSSGGSVGVGGSGVGIDGSGAAATGGNPSQLLPTVTACAGTCADFPADPILYADNGATPPPAGIVQRFGASGSAAPPCLLEPDTNALYPRNWLRPRVAFKDADNADVHEIRIHSDREAHDLVVYTTQKEWYMPRELWDAVSSHVGEEWQFSVTVRGIVSSNAAAQPSAPAIANFTIAPSTAAGSIVYWTTSDNSALKGFAVGDENVVDVFTPASVNGACLGCHSSTPDGEFVGMSVTDFADDGNPSYVQIRRGKEPHDEPAFLTLPAKALLGRTYQTLPVFSKSHWTDGDHSMLSMLFEQDPNEPTRIIWTDLEAASEQEGSGWGVLALNGDSKTPSGATWSHDGTKVVYTSANGITSGVNGTSDGNVYLAAFDKSASNTATALAGASEPGFNEYYPAFSADDELVVFNRVLASETSQNNPNAEVWVAPSSGGTPTRLAANDPPACSGLKSPGLTNSWAKWSPEAQTFGSKSYYWLIFSSKRADNGNPQLFATGIVLDGGTVRTYGAIYLWNQPLEERNHTPAWDNFQIPPTPPPPIVK